MRHHGNRRGRVTRVIARCDCRFGEEAACVAEPSGRVVADRFAPTGRTVIPSIGPTAGLIRRHGSRHQRSRKPIRPRPLFAGQKAADLGPQVVVVAAGALQPGLSLGGFQNVCRCK